MNDELNNTNEATENKNRKIKGLGIVGGILGGLALGGLGFLIGRGAKKHRNNDDDYLDDSELDEVEVEDDEFEVDKNDD